ncbi:MAG TPA: cyclic-di-AMP-binding protein CbpB [Tetragenococcus sp.]|nr:cyclic-di-AMP-binding protein CbpB [Tetragenococcus sp.]
MIGPHIKALLLEGQDDFLIPAENVATVLYSHPLEHALLLLSNIRYSKIPVLDTSDHLVGLISLADIANKMMGVEHFDSVLLDGMTVADVMEVDVASVHSSDDLEDILHLLVDAPFLPAIDDDDIFCGIITRKEILKAVNHLVHDLERRYELIEKEIVKQDEQIKN